jgi:MYXO-CTERM domain-containing protein
LNEDQLGGPQKGSPCGPGNTRPFIGDDVQPTPVSGAVTTYQAGQTVNVQWNETVYHPGYFRIALAHKKPSDVTMDDLPNPPLTDSDECDYDKSAVPTTAHDNVLADGLFMVDDIAGMNRSLNQDVTLPDQPCDDCTLQVVQVMEKHGASSCFYFHCAEIKIVPAASGAAGAAGQAGSAPSAGSGAASRPAAASSGGCSVATIGAGSSTALSWTLIVALWALRRRQRQN